MPGTLKVRVHRALDLPVMNAASQLTTAYAVLKLDNTSQRTEICRKTLNPVWNADFRFEVDDSALQDEILLVKLWDYDPMGGDDPIGQVMIDLDALLKWDAPPQISGCFPIYDTLRGIRGGLELTIKLELFRDRNRYRDTSCGVQVFSSTVPPECYRTNAILGFVEELMLKDDPEFQWMDKIRSPRASNEARQAVFAELDGELQRKIGLKVLEMGGNAVLGYRQEFDLEGDAMVARGIGTVAILSPDTPLDYAQAANPNVSTAGLLKVPGAGRVGSAASSFGYDTGSPGSSWDGHGGTDHLHGVRMAGGMVGGGVGPHGSVSLAGSAHNSPSLQDRKGHRSSIGIGDPHPTHGSRPGGRPGGGGGGGGRPRSGVLGEAGSRSLQRSAVQLITLTRFPPGFVLHLGTMVKACSIKLCEDDKVETRDAWWSELRAEIKSHAVALGYGAIIGYSETTSIQDGVCLLSAIGTAATIGDRRTDTTTANATAPGTPGGGSGSDGGGLSRQGSGSGSHRSSMTGIGPGNGNSNPYAKSKLGGNSYPPVTPRHSEPSLNYLDDRHHTHPDGSVSRSATQSPPVAGFRSSNPFADKIPPSRPHSPSPSPPSPSPSPSHACMSPSQSLAHGSPDPPSVGLAPATPAQSPSMSRSHSHQTSPGGDDVQQPDPIFGPFIAWFSALMTSLGPAV